MTGFKSTRRPLSILLSVLIILLSLAAAGAFSISASAYVPTTLYVTISDHWNEATARYAAYFMTSDDNGNTWVDMTSVSGVSKMYKCSVPTTKTWDRVLIGRFDSTKPSNTFDRPPLWNQTTDIKFSTNSTGNNHITVSNTGGDENKGYDRVNGTWSTYTEPTYSIKLTGSTDKAGLKPSGTSVTATFEGVDVGSRQYTVLYNNSQVASGTVTITEPYAKVTITYNTSTKKVTTPVPEYPEYHVIGSISNASPIDTYKMKYVSTAKRYELTISDKNSGSYNYQIRKAYKNSNPLTSTLTSLPITKNNTTVTFWANPTATNITPSSSTYGYSLNPLYTATLDGYGIDENMTLSGTYYTATFEHVKQGDITYYLDKNGTSSHLNSSSTTLKVDEWDSTVTLRLNSAGTFSSDYQLITPPKYVIWDGANGLSKNTEPNSTDPNYNFKYDSANDIYTLPNAFEVAENGSYTYKISKDGATDVEETVSVPHDYSSVTVTCTVKGNSKEDITGKATPTPPKYTYNETEFTEDSANNNYFSLTISNLTANQNKFEIKRNGTTFETVSVEGEVKAKASITIYYDESTHKLAYKLQQPPEDNPHYGDINNDKKYNVIDAYIIRKIVDAGDDNTKLQDIGLDKGTDSLEYKLADVNESGAVDDKDLELINDYIVGNIEAGASGGNKIKDEYIAP